MKKSNNVSEDNFLEEMMNDLDLDDSVCEHDLSDIVSTIVNRGKQLPVVHHAHRSHLATDSYHTQTFDMSVDKIEISEQIDYNLWKPTSSVLKTTSENELLDHRIDIRNSSKKSTLETKSGDLAFTLADMSIDDKENDLQNLPTDQTYKSSNDKLSCHLETNDELDVSYNNFYDFGNMSYSEDYNMPAESTPISTKGKKKTSEILPQCKFSLGLGSLLDVNMSLTE